MLIEGLLVWVLVFVPSVLIFVRFLSVHWRDLQCEIKAFDLAHKRLMTDHDSHSEKVEAVIACGHVQKKIELWKLESLATDL